MGRPRILVVDDERLIADTIREILAGAGFEVASAYDGWSALETAVAFRPEYLLSDVSMPKMNGVQLGMALSKIYPGIKILLLSGQAGIADMLREGEREAYDFDLISKPIHPLRLIEIIKAK